MAGNVEPRCVGSTRTLARSACELRDDGKLVEEGDEGLVGLRDEPDVEEAFHPVGRQQHANVLPGVGL